MTYHLPECIDYYNSAAQTVPCICPALRACEQRVREWAWDARRPWGEAQYQRGLDAARDAVVVLHTKFTDALGVDRCNYCWLDDYGDSALAWPCPTVAAIDAMVSESAAAILATETKESIGKRTS